MKVRRIIAVVGAAIGLTAIAVPALAEPIRACNTDQPDMHVTVADTVEVCFRYPVGSHSPTPTWTP